MAMNPRQSTGPIPPPAAATPPSALEATVQVLGVLLIVAGVIRLGFVVRTLFAIPAAVLQEQPYILAVAIVIPAIFAGAGLAAGMLMALRSPTARGVGLVVCGISLLFQLYGIANSLYVASTTPDLILPWTVWVIGPAFALLFIVCIVCLARWRPALPPLLQP
jgi:hypothetical protein